MIYIKQKLNGEWMARATEQGLNMFWENTGILQPFIVSTQAEADYMFSMQLMLSKEIIVLVDGVDENTTGLPPTYLKIDLPLQ